MSVYSGALSLVVTDDQFSRQIDKSVKFAWTLSSLIPLKVNFKFTEIIRMFFKRFHEPTVNRRLYKHLLDVLS